MPNLSVITICKNEGKYLQYTVSSVINQSFQDFEIIVVDGFSEDNSTDFIHELSDPRIKFYQKEPCGIYDAINYGIEKSTGQVINVLNGGDFYASKDSALLSISALEKNNYDFVFSRPLYFYRDFNIIKSSPLKKNLTIPLISHQSVFYKKEIHNKYGFYDKKYKFSADFDLFIKMWDLKHNKSEEEFFSVVRVKDNQQASEIGCFAESKKIIEEKYGISNPLKANSRSKIYKFLKINLEKYLSSQISYRLKPIYWKYISDHDIFLQLKADSELESVFPIKNFNNLNSVNELNK